MLYFTVYHHTLNGVYVQKRTSIVKPKVSDMFITFFS